MFYFHWTILLLIPALIFTVIAQIKVKSTFAKMSKVRSASGMTGRQVAEDLLRRNSIHDVQVEEVSGNLTDHYDSRKKVLRLSESVYNSSSLAALGVAAHETGHAIQHARDYAPLNIRHMIFPVASFGSKWGLWLFIAGLFISQFAFLMDVGILLFAGAVLFHLVTLPVEFNASRRALAQLSGSGYLREEEVGGARSVLNAAALTYVAAAAMAVLQLTRLLILRDE